MLSIMAKTLGVRKGFALLSFIVVVEVRARAGPDVEKNGSQKTVDIMETHAPPPSHKKRISFTPPPPGENELPGLVSFAAKLAKGASSFCMITRDTGAWWSGSGRKEV